MKRPKARDKNTLEINELYFESTSLRVNKNGYRLSVIEYRLRSNV